MVAAEEFGMMNFQIAQRKGKKSDKIREKISPVANRKQ